MAEIVSLRLSVRIRWYAKPILLVAALLQSDRLFSWAFDNCVIVEPEAEK